MVYIQFQEVERHFTKEIEKLEKRIRSLEIKLAKTKIEELRGYQMLCPMCAESNPSWRINCMNCGARLFSNENINRNNNDGRL